jgi:hypothetical protein
MSASPASRRAMAEIDFGDGANVTFKVGNRSIHQFWHLFSSHFRYVLLAPQRRADSGKVAWTWREAAEKRPVTATELVEVRRRLSEANRSLAGGFGGIGRRDDDEGSSLESQVRATVEEMIGQLLAHRDSALAGFVCRTDAGLMLHSWGAAVAAQPYFPDAPHGEISGTVFVGVEHAATVTVVLENTQGIGGARVKSDKDGVFRFPNVAPGSYHLRVADRSDFPGGLTVEIERESIAGLELRSTSDEPLSMAGNIAPVAEDVSWFRRPWLRAVLLIFIFGVAIMAWWSKRASDAPVATQNQSSGWQAAKGQLAANNRAAPANDEHKLGQEGAFSTLSNSIPPPKILHPRHERAASEETGADFEQAPQQSEHSDASGQWKPEGKMPPADSREKPISAAGASSSAPSGQLKSSSGNPEEKVQSPEDLAGAVPNGDKLRSEKDKPAKSSRTAADNRKPGPPAMSSSATNAALGENTVPAGSAASAESAATIAPGSNGAKSAQPNGAKSPTANGAAGKNAELSEGNADAGAADSITPSPGAAGNGQLKPNPEKKISKPAKGGGTKEAALTPVEPAGTISDGNTPDDSTPRENRASGNGVKNPSLGKATSQNQVASQSEAGASPDEETAASVATSASSVSSGKKAAPVSTAAEKKSTSLNQTNEPSASADEADADRSTATQSPARDGNTPRVKRSQPAKKAAAISSVQQEEKDQLTDSDSAADSPMTISGHSDLPVTKKSAEPLIPMAKIHVSAWKQRLVRDLIVPTYPVTAAEEETSGALREKLRQEQMARMPKAFRQPRMSGGVVIELPALSSEKNPLHWRDDTGAVPSGSSVAGRRAELSWTDGVPPPNSNYTLIDSNGRVIATARIDGSGALVLKTTANSPAWYWCGIERSPTASENTEAKNSAAPFDWKLFSGAPIPSSWVRDDRWRNGRGQRIDLPLDATTRRTGNYQVTLTDPVTGWAIVNGISVQTP